MMYGAGDGNRTHATSLEGWDSTIELHSHICIQVKIALSFFNRLYIIPQHFLFVKTFFIKK